MDACHEMVLGYIEGSKPDGIEPGPNRSACYRHGFANARDDRRNRPRAPAATLRDDADACMRACGCAVIGLDLGDSGITTVL